MSARRLGLVSCLNSHSRQKYSERIAKLWRLMSRATLRTGSIAIALLAFACAKNPKDLSGVQASDISDVKLQGAYIIGPSPRANVLTITDRTKIDSFLHAFENRTHPTTIARDKVNTVIFDFKDGRTVSIGFGRTTVAHEMGPEVAAVLRPYINWNKD